MSGSTRRLRAFLEEMERAEKAEALLKEVLSKTELEPLPGVTKKEWQDLLDKLAVYLPKPEKFRM
jgi:hypothetical protein